MRVTGGEHRGRILKVPQTGTVRPTSDKMRQQLFNMLLHSPWAAGSGFVLDGAHVLDGFCGSGALGIEALSRGAAHCIFVDSNTRVLQIAKDNVVACRLDSKSQFFVKDVHKMGARTEAMPPRTLALLDPPYGKGLIAPALDALLSGNWLEANALIVAESEKGFSCHVPAALRSVHIRVDGDSQLNVWQT